MALEYYFNTIDTDQNGVITYPEFTKMALSFCVDEENSECVKRHTNVVIYL